MKFIICSFPGCGAQELAAALEQHPEISIFPHRLNFMDFSFISEDGGLFYFDGFNFLLLEKIINLRDIKFIFLQRENLFEKMLAENLHLDCVNTQSYFEKCSQDYNLLNQELLKRSFIKVKFEDLQTRWGEEISKIERFLGVSIVQLNKPKISANVRPDNFYDFQEYFQESRWSSFFPAFVPRKQLPKITNENRIINGLWIGNKLGPLEKLTIHSFQDNGHEFHLWLYDDLPVPAGCVRRDANEIIPREEVFEYSANTIIQKSVAGFSDIFRFALLYKVGGWYVDMDVTCVKPFDFSEEIVLRKNNWIGTPVANIIKLPKNMEFANDVWKKTKELVKKTNIDFILPMSILAVKIAEHDLQEHIVSPELFVNCLTTVKVPQEQKFVFETEHDRQNAYNNNGNFRASLINSVAYAVHWNNQYHSWNKIDTSLVQENTVYRELLDKHKVLR